jgi:hypothetical protein
MSRGPEQSMDEVLASIRRILSDDPMRAKPAAPVVAPEPEPLDLADPLPEIGKVAVSGYPGATQTLEDLTRAMLQPLLKEWLDANLPDIVAREVQAEVKRLAGKGG